MRKALAVLVACFSLACLPAVASAENPPSADQMNFATWNIMTYQCGSWLYGCTGWQGTWAYNNGYHWYIVVHYGETPGWGVTWNYCATTSFWRGYYHVDDPRYAC